MTPVFTRSNPLRLFLMGMG
ncbi:hypothetical protein Mgra_00002814 [Meloidogyne graminicola]|uniref:Uncharacterized protein n=1 Tax=Meloidogyne graminicola TaxID=189291 RepID=A0A8S9ZX75_9BILA|nr:hypothetical protein Mgra_00002814 [Meloidogyne graminicola]